MEKRQEKKRGDGISQKFRESNAKMKKPDAGKENAAANEDNRGNKNN